MTGILLLLALCVVMAVASFFAGSLPLSMTLSPSQMRLLSSLGVGVLVGTSLIIIIPEGIEAVSTPAEDVHIHRMHALVRRGPFGHSNQPRLSGTDAPEMSIASSDDQMSAALSDIARLGPTPRRSIAPRVDGDVPDIPDHEPDQPLPGGSTHQDSEHEHTTSHSAEIGLSLILGFVLMFLIDRLPKHATESMHAAPQTLHISLDSLGIGGESASSTDEESDGFLASLTPSPKRSRSLATTLGLVIHAAADGIAMGASSTTGDQKLGFIIFIAIMIHKAPAAFGLTSVLLKQGLSKRAARTHLVIFSLAAPAGALATWLLITVLGGTHMHGVNGKWWTGMLLLFSGGTFLYVAMHAMNEDSSHASQEHANGYSENGNGVHHKPEGPQLRDTIATMAGMLLPLLTQLGGHHHH